MCVNITRRKTTGRALLQASAIAAPLVVQSGCFFGNCCADEPGSPDTDGMGDTATVRDTSINSPNIQIRSPSANQAFTTDAIISLEVRTFGALARNPSVTWASNIDGELGTVGAHDAPLRVQLSEGQHTLKASSRNEASRQPVQVYPAGDAPSASWNWVGECEPGELITLELALSDRQTAAEDLQITVKRDRRDVCDTTAIEGNLLRCPVLASDTPQELVVTVTDEQKLSAQLDLTLDCP